jgi:hypothetical protein
MSQGKLIGSVMAALAKFERDLRGNESAPELPPRGCAELMFLFLQTCWKLMRHLEMAESLCSISLPSQRIQSLKYLTPMGSL